MNVFTESYITPEPWTQQAACATSAPDAWFPESKDESTAREAKRICRDSCPVRAECLEFALRTKQSSGIWGGYVAKSLQRLRKERS